MSPDVATATNTTHHSEHLAGEFLRRNLAR
jgi:hypothetical protein